jgi:7-carboxy-7-deazaguanine synthase
MSFSHILAQVDRLGLPLVEVTGGEPLEQDRVFDLLDLLVEKGLTVLLETGGHIPCQRVNPAIHKIIDMKCPGSKMEGRNHLDNLNQLGKKDEIKFVIKDRVDFDWSSALMSEYDLSERTQVLFSPVHQELDPQKLVSWILDAGLQVRFQLQLHKIIWGVDARGV